MYIEQFCVRSNILFGVKMVIHYPGLPEYVLTTTVICTNHVRRNKYYQIIDDNVICTARNASTGLCTTSANWNKYYHLPRTGLCTTVLYWIMT
jgi:hypothetical protein